MQNPEQEILDAIERQVEVIEAIAARRGEKGKEYAHIVAETVSSMASIWYVLKDERNKPLKEMLERAAEGAVIAGALEAMKLVGLSNLSGKRFEEVLAEFEVDLLSISRFIYLESGDEVS